MQDQIYVSNIQQALLAALSKVLTTVIAFIPQLISAGLVILVGFLVGRWAQWLTVTILETLRFSKVVKNSPFEKFLEKAEITTKIEEILATIVRWLVLMVFFIASLNLLGLSSVSYFLTSILGYIPSIVAAILILTIGTIVAGIIESLVKSSLSQISRSTGRMVSKLGSYVVMVFTVLAALAQLGIAQELIQALFIGFVAMLALGLGLAFGLGSKDLVAKVLDEWYENLKKDHK